ncbi:MAG: TetR family transcriptional regulator, partial [Lachnospiraceae bacterium]
RRAKCREHIRETRIHMPRDMKDNIAEAARRLLMENNVKKLTVKDIVEECQITRQTFYYHFQDIPELISWVIERETERLRSKAEAQEDPEKRLKFFFAVSLNAMPYIRQSMLTNYRDEIGRILLAHFRRMIEESAEGKELAHRCSQAEFDLIIRYHSMAILGILASWSEEDTKHQDEVVHQIYKMIAEGIKIKQ